LTEIDEHCTADVTHYYSLDEKGIRDAEKTYTKVGDSQYDFRCGHCHGSLEDDLISQIQDLNTAHYGEEALTKLNRERLQSPEAKEVAEVTLPYLF